MASHAAGDTAGARKSARAETTNGSIQALLEESRNFRARGYKRRALSLLEEARAGGDGATETPAFELEFASLLYDLGAYPDALTLLARLTGDGSKLPAGVRIGALGELGLVQSALNDHAAAVTAFNEAIALARASGDALSENQLRANLARTALEQGDAPAVTAALVELDTGMAALPATADKAELLISVANVARSAYWIFTRSPQLFLRASDYLVQAGAIASDLGEPRLLSYARGNLARLYEDDGAFDVALAMSREAAFHASAAGAYESAYLWEWQIGRIENKKGETAAAVANYKEAIETLEHVRQDLIDGSPYTFNQKVMPLFTELSDILLREAPSLPTPAARQERYRYVQSILEQAKSAELQDYFKNECVLPETSVALDQVEAATATVYPVILPDRVEMLVSIAGEIHQYATPIEQLKFEQLVHEFRDNLQSDYGDEDYLDIGEDLYHLLIEQFAPLLAASHVETLLFVPDGVLRTVPIAALYDGEEFLVERFAIATTPGLKLTLPRKLEFQQASLFAGGISEAVQGFTGLPGVPGELGNLRDNYGADVLQDNAFKRDTVTREMASNDYDIVHIATHGHFDSNPEKSFLLAYDDKLTMNLLEKSIGYRKYLGNPLELLVLSACETAAGDNRAALGLAGVALKAGARSAVATLWQISDAATVELIREFYRNESGGTLSKAKALQAAQVKLIHNPRFTHPTDWAPFLLIGNWL